MLTELRVRDLGVVEDVTIAFAPGMTVLTGETGAGKTLLVEALVGVLGGRVGPSAVRAGASEAVIEARFEVTAAGHGDPIGPASRGRAAPPGLAGDDVAGAEDVEPPDAVEVILSRSVPVQGRSRCWIDGRMATVTTLAQRGGAMVDVHGLREQHSLLTAAGQRRALDEYGDLTDSPVREGRRRLRALEQEIAALGGPPEERARQLDLLRFQVHEITSAGVEDPAEDDRLRAEEEQLADLAAHREAVRDALAALGGGHLPGEGSDGEGALERLAAASSSLSGRGGFSGWRDRLDAAAAELDDVAADLRTALDGSDDDPRQLDEVQARRRVLAGLRRKYGGELDEVLAFADEAKRRLAELESVADRLEGLQRHRDRERQILAAAETRLKAARQAAADRLAAAVDERLRSLAMAGATLRVRVSEEGARDEVRFLLAANPGEPPRPLAEVASGGELARATLALRLLTSGGPDTVVFDEVDAGVGGKAALALAAALQEVARGRQVLVVTHLPQVAAFADHHIVVKKSVRGGRTLTEAVPVDGDRRLIELSRMLSGHPGSATARAHARELLSKGQGTATSTSSGAGWR